MDFGCRRAYMDYHEFILTRVVSWADVEAAAAPLPPPAPVQDSASHSHPWDSSNILKV